MGMARLLPALLVGLGVLLAGCATATKTMQMGPLGNGVRGQALVGGLFAALAAFVSVKFLLKYFETRTLTPFAIYCVLFGAAMAIRFA